MQNGSKLFLVLLLGYGAAASAQSSYYVGLFGGQSTTSRDLVANRENTITLATDIRTAFDDNDGAWKIVGGYRWGEHFGVELHYADLGRHKMLTTMQGGDPPFPASIEINRRVKGFGADFVLAYPFANRFSAFGRIGVFQAQIDADAMLEGNIEFAGGMGERFRRASIKERVSSLGTGVDWRFSERAALRIDWQRYRNVGKAFEQGATGTTGEADTDMVSIGVLWRF